MTVTPSSNKLCDFKFSIFRSRDNPDSENEEEGGGGDTIGHWSAEIEEMDISKVNTGILRDKTMGCKLMFIPIMIYKISPSVDYNFWLKRLDT